MNWKFCALLLIIALLAFLCACNLQEAPQPLDGLQTSASSTAPSEEPTASATEKSEPPTELPSDVTGQTEPYVIDDESFAVYNEKDQIYHYIGQGQTVTVKDVGLEIHVPEEWAGRVEVLRNACSDRVEIYIGNIQLMQTYADMNHDEIQESYGWLDWILRVQAIRKDDTATIEEFDQSEHRICLGENDRYRIYFSCTDMHDMDCETFFTSRANMIHNRGEEYYDNLVGDLTCTAEQAKEILKIL